MKEVIISIFAIILTGCASINSLPQSAEEVTFELSDEGRTGWSEYQDTMYIKNADKQTAYLAAKAGLADAGFTIKKSSFDNLVVIGEHGMTAYDWNIVAGVYIKETQNGCWVKTIVEGSKDVGFWGDMTASSWNQDIFKGIREYIALESNITDTNKKHFR